MSTGSGPSERFSPSPFIRDYSRRFARFDVKKLLLFVLFTGCFRCSGEERSEPWPLWDGKESVASYAARVKLPATKTIDFGNGVSMELVLIPAGEFVAGQREPVKPTVSVFEAQILVALGCASLVALLILFFVRRKPGARFSFSLMWLLALTASLGALIGGTMRLRWASLEEAHFKDAQLVYLLQRRIEELGGTPPPPHNVVIPHPFYMGKYPVTQEQYESVIGRNYAFFTGAKNPVERVTWYNARDYCKKAHELFFERQLPDVTFELPTEDEWEYACKAGTQTPFYSGETNEALSNAGWYRDNSSMTTHPVGLKIPNAFGLYDMHGNVRQWCMDVFDKPLNLRDRVTRGGSWMDSPGDCNSTSRHSNVADTHESYIGFRVIVRVTK
ncbi:MAG: formylglycine-generating enzyme family protein [Planctomycetota bacterium]